MTAPRNTLGSMMIHPSTQYVDISSTPVSVVGPIVKAAMGDGSDKSKAVSKGNPDMAAVSFYALNHMMAILASVYDRMEPLRSEDVQVMNKYKAFLTDEGVRAATYLLLITIRESRHAHLSMAADSKIANEVSPAAVKWIRKHTSGENYNSLWLDPPNCTFGQLVTCIRRFFYEVPFSGSFGGKPWGNVTDCLEAFIYGKTTLEVMLDTNWTLAHNNGPIFNKGMLYTMYSPKLKEILDVQRGGAILSGIMENHECMSHAISPDIRALTQMINNRYPGSIPPFIDWYSVKALGGLGTYIQYQNAQIAKHGMSPMAEKVEAIKAAQKAKLQAKYNAQQKADAEKYYQVDYVTKIEKIARLKKA